MKLVYTEQAWLGLAEALSFLGENTSEEKVIQVRDRILDKVDTLQENPYIGQREPYLAHLGREHRRLIEGYYKIIYRVEGEVIYITDIFDSRQNPSNMQG